MGVHAQRDVLGVATHLDRKHRFGDEVAGVRPDHAGAEQAAGRFVEQQLVSILTGPSRPVLHYLPNRLVWLGLSPRLREPTECSLPLSTWTSHENRKFLFFKELELTRSSPVFGTRFRFALRPQEGHRS